VRSKNVSRKLHPGPLTLLTALLLTGCHAAAPTEPDTIVILVDKSASTTGPKNASYADYLDRYVIPAIPPGAHVVLEPIAGANTYSDPTLRIVTTMPPVTMLHKDWSYYLLKGDISVDKTCLAHAESDLAQFNQARTELQSEAQRVLRSRETSSSTFLLDGMKEASESLEQRTGPGILVVLSDGLEDSSTDGRPIKFNDEGFWSKHPPAALVRELDPTHTAPGLKGAKVYFFGMAAGNGPTYTHVRDFWKSYLAAAQVKNAAVGHQPLYEEPAFRPTATELCK
jgi:hypothetical protein